MKLWYFLYLFLITFTCKLRLKNHYRSTNGLNVSIFVYIIFPSRRTCQTVLSLPSAPQKLNFTNTLQESIEPVADPRKYWSNSPLTWRFSSVLDLRYRQWTTDVTPVALSSTNLKQRYLSEITKLPSCYLALAHMLESTFLRDISN